MTAAPLPGWARVLLIPVLNILLAVLVSGAVIAAIGEDPVAALAVMVEGAFLVPGGLGYTLYYTTNFIFTGLAVAIAFKAGLFNIGGEGQAGLAGLGVALACLAVDPWLPGALVIVAAILAAAAAGAAWAAVPGWLQAYRGSHVVITTIMFNFIAAGVIVGLLAGPLMGAGQGSPQTRSFADAATLPQLHEIARGLGLKLSATPVNVSLFLALAAAAAVWVLIWRTRFGYALRAMGEAPGAAEYAGIKVRRMTVVAMALSGALAAGMAVNEVLGVQGRLVINFTSGYGFTGIAVALMGRAHPVGIVLAALLFGALYQGGAELAFVFPSITREMVLVIQGLIIFFSGALALMLEPPLARVIGVRRNA